jgi:hypothetical protein
VTYICSPFHKHSLMTLIAFLAASRVSNVIAAVPLDSLPDNTLQEVTDPNAENVSRKVFSPIDLSRFAKYTIASFSSTVCVWRSDHITLTDLPLIDISCNGRTALDKKLARLIS